VLPDVASTIVVLPGSISPAASAASIIATPIRSLTLPAGFPTSSFAISSALQSGAIRFSQTTGVLPIRSAGLEGISIARAYRELGRIPEPVEHHSQSEAHTLSIDGG
jgi:hypothetical protein